MTTAQRTPRTPRTEKPKPAADDGGQVSALARDMLITTINAGSLPQDAEAVRHFVRLARAFYSEVHTPTAPPAPKKRRAVGGDDEGADISGAEDDLLI